MTTKPDNTLWEIICILTDHFFCLHKLATGRPMALMVLPRLPGKKRSSRTPQLSLMVFTEDHKVTIMQTRGEEKKRNNEGLKFCLPRKVQPAAVATTSASRQ
ncbi:hypothetical protein XENORESO_000557 [Xenotaenia resolanae]|uniref:Uncharacterized protein n=1 Tax=Xenotaenia resolanae TaxID=208358 RepID=A0ABV0WJ94_9TELE